MPNPDQPEIDRLTATIMGAYARAGARIEAELQAVLEDPTQYRRRARLKALAAEVADLKTKLDGDIQGWADDGLRSIYELGATAGAVSIGSSFSFTQVHEAALKVAAGDLTESMLDATEHMSSDVKRLVRASTKEAVLMKLLTGQTAVQAGRELQGELKTNAVSAVRYKDGSRHTIKEYSQMALRSTAASAYNIGTLTEAKEEGVRYAIAFDGPECCLESHTQGPRANNLILPLGKALKYPISHPNCRRSWSALPEIRGPKEAKDAMEAGTYATTLSQDAAQQAADVVTRGQQRLAARKRARENRLAARAAKVSST